ncbi:MAG: hypothetical protein U0930_17715 [Pirellulales bacterium]
MQTILFIIVPWSIAVVAIAFLLHRTIGASGRPTDWIPFVLLGPLIASLILGAVAVLIPVLIVAALFAPIVYLFGSILSANHEGLVLTRRLSAKQKVLRWSAIEEIIETEEHNGTTVLAVLKGGLRIHLNCLDKPTRTAIVEHGVPLRFIPIDELGT